MSINARARLLGVVLIAIGCVATSIPAKAQPSPVINNGQDTVLFVGDSLTVGTAYFGSLKQKVTNLGIWANVLIDAKVGRLTTDGARVLRSKIDTRTTAVVVALGTNDMISRRDPSYPPGAIDNVMQQTNGLPTLWCNIEFSPTGRGDWRFRARRFNRALRDAQTRWPNLFIADWDKAFTPSGRVRYIADGVHLNVSAYKVRSTFFVSQMRAYGNNLVAATSTTTTSPPSTTTSISTTTSPATTTTTSP